MRASKERLEKELSQGKAERLAMQVHGSDLMNQLNETRDKVKALELVRSNDSRVRQDLE